MLMTVLFSIVASLGSLVCIMSLIGPQGDSGNLVYFFKYTLCRKEKPKVTYRYSYNEDLPLKEKRRIARRNKKLGKNANATPQKGDDDYQGLTPGSPAYVARSRSYTENDYENSPNNPDYGGKNQDISDLGYNNSDDESGGQWAIATNNSLERKKSKKSKKLKKSKTKKSKKGKKSKKSRKRNESSQDEEIEFTNL